MVVLRHKYALADSEPSRQSTSQSAHKEEVKEWQDAWDEGDKMETRIQGIDQHDAFWEKLKVAAEMKVLLLLSY
ncbi:unnamed protein product [Ilex paraguariensis]|uniref:Uncharacterized protein n=1 Tax=Ilex paraguariensis TaxID=185542 RepID=A0ABC8UT70_9AQUA